MILEGTPELIANLKAYAIEKPKEYGRAVYQEMLIEMKESMRRCPVAPNEVTKHGSGELRASHEIHLVVDGLDTHVSITVGGPSAPYAIYVHEILDYYHPNGQAKFLESTILESAPFMAERIANRAGIGGDSSIGMGGAE